MKILTVDANSTGGTMLRLTRDADRFHINAADCGPDCRCGHSRTARAADRTQEILAAIDDLKQLAMRHAVHAAHDRVPTVSDAALKTMPLAAVVKLAGPKVSPTSDEASLGRRASSELIRRFLLTGDTADPDPVNMQTLSVTELIRCTAPRQERLTERQSVLAKRALTELFRRQWGG